MLYRTKQKKLAAARQQTVDVALALARALAEREEANDRYREASRQLDKQLVSYADTVRKLEAAK